MLLIRQQQLDALAAALGREPVLQCGRHWIEIRLVDKWDEPVPGERYELRLPDGIVLRGSLDEDGCARLEGIQGGLCEVSFPDA